MDRYKVNDALSALANDAGVELSDEQLNELTHHVADVLEGKRDNEIGNPSWAITFGDGTREKILTMLTLLEGCNIAVWYEGDDQRTTEYRVLRVARRLGGEYADLWVLRLDNESEPTSEPIALSLVEIGSIYVY
jgi:hypothetical protein